MRRRRGSYPVTPLRRIAHLARALPISTHAMAAAALVLAATATIVACRSSDVVRVARTPGGVIALDHEPDIRVRLDIEPSNLTFRGAGALLARAEGLSGGQATLGPATTLVVDPAGIDIMDSAGRLVGRTPSRLELIDSAGGPIVLGSAALDARVELRVTPSGVDVVAVMPMEPYIAGVLAKELVSNWSLEAFKAQAVAARSFAMQRRAAARRAGRFYDLESTTDDQVFAGRTTLAGPVHGATSTRGLVLNYQGQILTAYYSSTCGGRPASSAAVWSDTGAAARGPLGAIVREHACEISPVYRWKRTVPLDVFIARLRGWGERNTHAIAGLRNVSRVEASAAEATGRPSRYRISGSSGVFELTAEQLRSAVSRTVGGGPLSRDDRALSSDMSITVSGGAVTIEGRGFGHGVGLCQWCAEGFARSGMRSTTMLDTFYPGASVSRVY